MSLSRDSRQERKWKTIRRAQYRLQQALDRIDFEEDVLGPEIEAIKSGKAVLGLPENATFQIEIVHEDPNQDTSQNT